MSLMLDTNVLSEMRKPKPDPRVVSFISSASTEQLFTTTIALAEIRFGIECTLDLEKRTLLQRWIEKEVRPYFGTRVLAVTENVMLRWRHLVEDGRKMGRTYAQPDLIIAAIVLETGMTLVTRNIRDFEGTSVRLVNPWEMVAR